MADPMNTFQAQARKHLSFAERQCGTVSGISENVDTRSVKVVGIVGAGTMGGGIAMNFANAGIPVRLLEIKQDALDRGLRSIRGNYESNVKRGRLTEREVEERMALVQGTLCYDDLGDVDLVIEAAFESMAVKKAIFSHLDRVCKPGAILATNTSTLDVNEIARATGRPQDVIGLHFFSPAHVMKLLEIVRGAETAPEVVATVLDLAKVINKIGVVVGVCFGFVGNRMLEPYAREAHRLVLEGASPQQVDWVLTDFGMAMGVLSMYDLAGIDVGFQQRQARRDEIAHDPSYYKIADRLYQLGRYGQKTGHGFYIYEGRKKFVDAEVELLAEKVAGSLKIRRRNIDDQEIFERCIFSMINEGADILAEGIAHCSYDIDTIWCNGYGFPDFRGGPMHYADEIGLDTVLQGIGKYRSQLGDYGAMWFTPSPLLKTMVAEGKKLRELRA